MATTYTTSNRLAKQGTGDNADTWGSVLNASVMELIDEANDGVTSVNVTTGINVTLTTANGATDEARKKVIKLSGTPTANIQVIVPNLPKTYLIDGIDFAGSFTVTIIGSTGTGVAFTAGDTGVVYCDATNVRELYKTPTSAASATPSFRAGDFKDSGRSTDHDTWLLRDGRTLDSVTDTQYAPLFTAIGTAYGGTGASNFKIPDARGRVDMGLDDMGTAEGAAGVMTNASALTLGGTGGAEKPVFASSTDGHALTSAENGPHTHTQDADTMNTAASGSNNSLSSPTDGRFTTGGTTASSGSGTAHSHTLAGVNDDLTQPWMGGYKFITYDDV